MSPIPNHPVFETTESTEQAFYDAVNRRDIDGIMLLWADEDEVVCVHPNGDRYIGLSAIRESWSERLHEAYSVRLVSARVFGSATIAVHHVIEEVTFTLPDDQVPSVTWILATNVYIATPSGWRLALHHSSPAGNEALASEMTGLLH